VSPCQSASDAATSRWRGHQLRQEVVPGVRVVRVKNQRMMPVIQSDGRLSARHSHSAFYHHLSNPSLCRSLVRVKKICAAPCLVALRIRIDPPLCPRAPLAPLAALVLTTSASGSWLAPLNTYATVLINQTHRQSALPIYVTNFNLSPPSHSILARERGPVRGLRAHATLRAVIQVHTPVYCEPHIRPRSYSCSCRAVIICMPSHIAAPRCTNVCSGAREPL
jgi:hypothetical protein